MYMVCEHFAESIGRTNSIDFPTVRTCTDFILGIGKRVEQIEWMIESCKFFIIIQGKREKL